MKSKGMNCGKKERQKDTKLHGIIRLAGFSSIFRINIKAKSITSKVFSQWVEEL